MNFKNKVILALGISKYFVKNIILNFKSNILLTTSHFNKNHYKGYLNLRSFLEKRYATIFQSSIIITLLYISNSILNYTNKYKSSGEVEIFSNNRGTLSFQRHKWLYPEYIAYNVLKIYQVYNYLHDIENETLYLY